MNRNEKITFYDEKIFSYSNKFFSDSYIISNSTFNKNHFAGTNLLINFLKNASLKPFKLNLVVNTLKFYAKNFFYFFLFFTIYIINFIFRKKKNFLTNKKNSIILIDTFIRNSSNYINTNNIIIQDNYFDNLYIYLNKKKIKYNLFVKFNDLNLRPLQVITILKKFNNHQNVYTIYDFLSFYDL